MKLLLDTQAFLWFISDAPEASPKAKQLFLDEKNQLFISLASIWEIAIKTSLGKLIIKQPLESFLTTQLQENGIALLEIHFRHVVRVATLPYHHRDPFDRLIISQALVEKMPLVSSDSAFDHYEVKRFW